jgi:hypothetical protein
MPGISKAAFRPPLARRSRRRLGGTANSPGRVTKRFRSRLEATWRQVGGCRSPHLPPERFSSEPFDQRSSRKPLPQTEFAETSIDLIRQAERNCPRGPSGPCPGCSFERLVLTPLPAPSAGAAPKTTVPTRPGRQHFRDLACSRHAHRGTTRCSLTCGQDTAALGRAAGLSPGHPQPSVRSPTGAWHVLRVAVPARPRATVHHSRECADRPR